MDIQAQLTQFSPAPTTFKASPTGRKPIPTKLLRIEHRHEPTSCACKQCGKDMVKISEDISEQFDVEPARFFVLRHIGRQYAFRACETVSATAIPAAPGLHAWGRIQKYLDCFPPYRIEQISTRHCACIARSTQAEWVGKIGVALQPPADRLAELLRQRQVLHANETPVPSLILARTRPKRAYYWHK